MFLQYVLENRTDLGGATLIVADGAFGTLRFSDALGVQCDELDLRVQGDLLCGIRSM